MRTVAKGSQEEEEYEDDEFGSKKEGPSSSTNNLNNKDAKNNDKANAMRSKHSVTEQRRRSKINERFQMLRDLVPHSDQKRDTASFLLEVIEYVQFLQEKVTKYEGSYQGWSPEPTKLMPWGIPLPMPPPGTMSATNRSDGALGHSLQIPVSDAQPIQCPITNDALNQQNELTVEGGTISISSAYSRGLLNTLSQALQSAGLDLSQANIAVQIDLGKRANRVPSSGTSISKDYEDLPSGNQTMPHQRDSGSGDDSDQANKRLKT